MKIDEQTYVDSIYFVSCPLRDWFCIISKQADGPWEIEYRFRYYALNEDGTPNQDAWNGQDKKSFYNVTLKDNSDGSLQQARSGCQQMLQMLVERGFGNTPYAVEVQGGPQAFAAVMQAQPWAHCRTAPSDDTQDLAVKRGSVWDEENK